MKLQKGFAVSDGPFVKGVETALESLNVHCQQYHNGVFIGNHVQKLLQVISSETNVNCLIVNYNLLFHAGST